jgi:hypothetical protein
MVGLHSTPLKRIRMKKQWLQYPFSQEIFGTADVRILVLQFFFG